MFDFSSLLTPPAEPLKPPANIQSITLVQEEHSTHFHLWLFPWYNWMIEKCGGSRYTHQIYHGVREKHFQYSASDATHS